MNWETGFLLFGFSYEADGYAFEGGAVDVAGGVAEEGVGLVAVLLDGLHVAFDVDDGVGPDASGEIFEFRDADRIDEDGVVDAGGEDSDADVGLVVVVGGDGYGIVGGALGIVYVEKGLDHGALGRVDEGAGREEEKGGEEYDCGQDLSKVLFEHGWSPFQRSDW